MPRKNRWKSSSRTHQKSTPRPQTQDLGESAEAVLVETKARKDLVRSERRLDELCSWMRATLRRDNASLALHNIAQRAAVEAGRARARSRQTDEIASAARNLFELRLTLEWIHLSHENYMTWLGSLGTDQRDMLKGFLALPEMSHNPAERQLIEQEIDRYHQVFSRLDEQMRKMPPVAVIAKELGMETEHRAFFRFASKFVHPTSLLVNSGGAWGHGKTEAVTESPYYRAIFLDLAQMDAQAILQVVRDQLSRYGDDLPST